MRYQNLIASFKATATPNFSLATAGLKTIKVCPKVMTPRTAAADQSSTASFVSRPVGKAPTRALRLPLLYHSSVQGSPVVPMSLEAQESFFLAALPKLELDSIPGFWDRVREKVRFDADFFTGFLDKIDDVTEFPLHALSPEDSALTRQVVERVLDGRMDAHLGWLYLRKIAERSFYRNIQRQMAVEVREVSPREAVARYEEGGLPSEAFSLRDFYRDLGVLDSDLPVFQLKFLDPDFRKNILYEWTFIFILFAAHGDDVFAENNGWAFLLPREMLLDIELRQPDAIPMRVSHRFYTFDEAMQCLSEGSWGYCSSPLPNRLVHFSVDQSWRVTSVRELEGIKVDLAFDPSVVEDHDTVHHRQSRQAGEILRPWVAKLSRDYARQNPDESLRNAFADQLLALAALEGNYAKTVRINGLPPSEFGITAYELLLANHQFLATLGNYYVALGNFDQPYFKALALKVILGLKGKDFLFSAGGLSALCPALKILSPMLQVDSPHLALALDILREPEVIACLQQDYGIELPPSGPRSLQDVFEAVPSLQGMFSLVRNEGSPEAFILKRLGLVREDRSNPIRSLEQAIQCAAWLVFFQRPIASCAPELLQTWKVNFGFDSPAKFWRALELEEKFRKRFPREEHFLNFPGTIVHLFLWLISS